MLTTLFFCHQSSASLDEDEDEKSHLQSESENNRREKFEALLKLQQENNGLIEPRKNLAILPGMFLPENVTKPSTSKETENEQCVGDASGAKIEAKSGHSLNKASTSRHNHRDSRRKNKYQSSKKPLHAPPNRQQWVKREL